jgi:hypothetical protein
MDISEDSGDLGKRTLLGEGDQELPVQVSSIISLFQLAHDIYARRGEIGDEGGLGDRE